MHRQLQQAIDQLGAAQRRNQSLQAELDELRVTLEQTVRAKRSVRFHRISPIRSNVNFSNLTCSHLCSQVEVTLEETQTRCNELQTINMNLSSAKSKIEAEYSALQADYDEVHKELRVRSSSDYSGRSYIPHLSPSCRTNATRRRSSN